jgi:hypothetical protein
MMIHDLTSLSMSDAYDETQISEAIHSGDLLITRDGVAIMDRAWPTMVPPHRSQTFHSFKPDLDFSDTETHGLELMEALSVAFEIQRDFRRDY